MFVGVTKLHLSPMVTQDLSMSFELKISPSTFSKPVSCPIALNRVIFGASRMKRMKIAASEPETTLGHYFILKEAWIMIKPVGGQSSPPDQTGPRMHDMFSNITETHSHQANVTLQGSITNPITVGASFAKQSSNERPTFVVEATLARSQTGEEQGYEWCWKPTSIAKTHLEFTTSNPPTHRVSYTILRNADVPKAISVKTKAIYEKKRLAQVPQIGRTFKAKLMKSVQIKDFIVELEAKIGTEGDFWRFPNDGKDGSYLTMDVDARSMPMKWGLERAAVSGVAAATLDSPRRAKA